MKSPIWVLASVLAGLTAAAGAGRSSGETPAPFDQRPVDWISRRELAELTRDYNHRRRGLRRDYRIQRRAFAEGRRWGTAAGSPVRSRQRASQAKAEFRAERTRLRRQYWSRRRMLLSDSELPAAHDPRAIEVNALRSELKQQRSALREEYQFRRWSLVHDQGRARATAEERRAQLEDLEREFAGAEAGLREEYWRRRGRWEAGRSDETTEKEAAAGWPGLGGGSRPMEAPDGARVGEEDAPGAQAAASAGGSQ